MLPFLAAAGPIITSLAGSTGAAAASGGIMTDLGSLTGLAGLASILGGGKGDTTVTQSTEIAQSQQSSLAFNPIINVSSPGAAVYPDIDQDLPQTAPPITQTTTQPVTHTETLPGISVPSIPTSAANLTPGIDAGYLGNIPTSGETTILGVNAMYVILGMGALALLVLTAKKKRKGR